MALDQAFIDAARKRLDEELNAIESELTDLGFPSEGSVDVSFDEGFADAAQTTSERGKALAISDELRHRLADVKAAIARIERGTYGACESCGNPIPEERLEAIPAARLCITCKQKK